MGMLREIIAKEIGPVILDLVEVTLVDREVVRLSQPAMRGASGSGIVQGSFASG